MSELVTQRLLQASAGLEPADRALLNLWVNRGLDDQQLAELTGMTADAVRSRREGIITALSRALDLPHADVRAGLAQIQPAVVKGEGRPVKPEAQPEADAMVPDPQPEEDTSTRERRLHVVAPLPPEDPEPPATALPARARRRRGPAIGATVVAAIVIIVVIVLLSSGSSHKATNLPASTSASASTPPASSTSSSPTSASASTTASSAAGAPTTTASTPTRAATTTGALATLPGGLKHSSGVVVLTGTSPRLKLRLTVKDLPAVKGGHYEAWLFNSVVDSRTLGTVPSGSHTRTFPLPAGARAYHSVDISFQPTGVTAHSGESKLRAVNPVDRLDRPKPQKAAKHH